MNEDYYFWTAEKLAEHIKVYHRRTQKLIERIENDFVRLGIAHSYENPQLIEVQILFMKNAQKMEKHMLKELITVFPFVKRYTKALKKRNKQAKPGLVSACPSIHSMYQEHKRHTLPFNLILHMLKKFTISEEGQPLYEKICNNIIQLRKQWQEQVHLENDILFPKLIEMEATLHHTSFKP